MIDGVLTLSFFLLVIAMLLGFYRLARGPTVVDRVLAFDAVVLCAVSLTVLLSRLWETPLYLELILIVSSLGFFGTVALVFYLERTMPDDGHDAGIESEPKQGGE
jgi:multicomponent Na+:H+ antiporter subunit F